jgi:hypothetical protein
MGKSQTPLTIAVTDAAMLEWPEIQKLQSQGHTIFLGGPHGDLLDQNNVDGVLGPNCWMMDETLRPFLKVAIQAMRDRRKGKKVSHGVEDSQILPKASGTSDESDGGGTGDSEAGPSGQSSGS